MGAIITKNTMRAMGMWSSSRSNTPTGLRIFLLSLGLAGLIWSAITLPSSWRGAPAKDVVNRILADDRFKASVLDEVLALIQAGPRPTVVRSNLVRWDALIWLRIAEEGTGRKKPEEADRAAAAAEDRLNSSLALNPADSFLWLMLYSIEIMRNGFDARAVGVLYQSYKSGPLEGWIALRRNRLALAAYPALDETVRERVISEFAGLVDSDFTEAAALNLMGIGWGQRDRLLTSLERVDIAAREAFAKRLVREGVTVNVPGVQLDERLWRQ